MNRRRRFVAKRKRAVTKVLADMMSAAHLNASERVTFLNLYRWPSEILTLEHALLVLRVVETNATMRFRVWRAFDVRWMQ